MVALEGGHNLDKGKTLGGVNTELYATYIMPTVAFDLYKNTYAGLGVAYIEWQKRYIETEASNAHKGFFGSVYLEQQFKIFRKFRVALRGGVSFGRGKYTSNPMDTFEGENPLGWGILLALGVSYQPSDRLSFTAMPINLYSMRFSLMMSQFVAKGFSYGSNVPAMLRVGYHF